MNIEEAGMELKRISEKDYTARLADVLGRYEEQDTVEHAEGSPEMTHMPTEEQLAESIRNWKPTITFAPTPLTEDRVREIFRDEMAKWEKSLTHRVRMNRPTR